MEKKNGGCCYLGSDTKSSPILPLCLPDDVVSIPTQEKLVTFWRAWRETGGGQKEDEDGDDRKTPSPCVLRRIMRQEKASVVHSTIERNRLLSSTIMSVAESLRATPRNHSLWLLQMLKTTLSVSKIHVFLLLL